MASYFVNTLNLPVTWDGVNVIFATSSGGTPTVANPGAGDTVTIDAASGSGTITVNTNFNITSLTCGAMNTTLDFSANNNSPTMQTFSGTGTGTRTINLGSGTFTITGTGTSWTLSTTTNLTFSAGTSTLNFTDSSATAKTPSFGGLTYNNINFSAGSGALNIGGLTIKNLNFTGYTGALGLTGSATTITGNLTLGAGMTANSGSQGWTFAATSGTNIITSNGVATRSSTFNGVGGTWQFADAFNIDGFTLTLTNGALDANNKNITCSAFSSSNSNTRTLTMGSGTWTLTGNNATIWTTSTTTGLTFNPGTSTINANYSGSTGTRTFTFGGLTVNNISVSAGSDTVSCTCTCNNLDYTGFTGVHNANAQTINGSLTLGAGMTMSGGSNVITFAATSGTKTITSNGVTVDRPLTFNGVGGTWQFADSFVGGATRTMTLSNGTLNANNQNITTGLFASSNSNTRTLTMGSGTWTLTGTGTVWNTSTTTGLTLNPGTSTIKINDASASSKTFSGGALTFYNLLLSGAGSGVFVIGTSTATTVVNNITVDTPPHTVQFFAGKTIVANSLTWSGTAGNLNTFQSTTNGTAWNIEVASGTIDEDYISLQDSAASGGALFYAGPHSVNVSGNSGWIFSAEPAESAAIDGNGRATLTAVSSADGITIVRLYADPTTGALLIQT